MTQISNKKLAKKFRKEAKRIIPEQVKSEFEQLTKELKEARLLAEEANRKLNLIKDGSRWIPRKVWNFIIKRLSKQK